MKIKSLQVAAALLLLGTGSQALAAPVTFTGAGTGSQPAINLMASATFAIDGGALSITLTNTATGSMNSSADMLTGLFFDIVDSQGQPLSLSLDPTTAILPVGNKIVNLVCADPPGPTGPDPACVTLKNNATSDGTLAVGGEWVFNDAVVNPTKNVGDYGISSTGLGGVFGTSNPYFDGSRLPEDGGTPPDGPAYGIASAGYTAGGGNSALSTTAMIQNQVVFKLVAIAPDSLANFDPVAQIRNVAFQYGTAQADPTLCVDEGTECGGGPPTGFAPEPNIVLLFSTGLLGLAYRFRRVS
jgi:hypothetical protein